MKQRLYYTGEFAQKASVTIRTLRYYDRVGLLSPSRHSEAGYRLYTDDDLLKLQQILALKFLGFSLDEIQRCLRTGPLALRESLELQKVMMRERRSQLDAVIQAIDETAELLRTNQHDWDSIVHVIQVIQTQQNNGWRQKYFSDDQLKQMEALSQKSYTTEQRELLQERAKSWSEEDQIVASRRWNEVGAELQRLQAEEKDPASPEAQALAERWMTLLNEFTLGDPGIEQGLRNLYQNAQTDAPFLLAFNSSCTPFLKKAIEIYKQRQQ